MATPWLLRLAPPAGAGLSRPRDADTEVIGTETAVPAGQTARL